MIRRVTTVIVALLAALALAACGGDGTDGATDDGTDGGGAAASTVTLTGTDALAFEPTDATAAAGEITVELTAEEAINHTFVVEGVNDDEPVVEAEAGEIATGTVTLEEGTYTFYCDVPGHRDAGMEGTLEVEG